MLVITQLSSLLFNHLTFTGAAETLFLLLVAWWAWLYTTWATNWFDPDRGPVRAVLVGGMLASMLGAAAIPDAFGERALLLVVGYVGIQSVRNAFMVLATDRDDPLHMPFVRIFAWNLWVGAIWFTGALAGHEARTAFWIAALVCDRRTNKEIAGKLFLSDKTIESHLRNIFVKLGVSSRVDVARAVERDRAAA